MEAADTWFHRRLLNSMDKIHKKSLEFVLNEAPE